MRLTFWTGLWVFLADQASKYIVVHWLDLINRLQIDVIPPYLTFRMAWNRGVNFGIGSGFDMRWVLIAVALIIAGIVLYWVKREGGSKWTYISAGLLVGGAVGNVVDRLIFGAVADFLNMSCCGWSPEISRPPRSWLICALPGRWPSMSNPTHLSMSVTGRRLASGRAR